MNKNGLDSLLHSHCMFLDSRASDIGRDKLEVLCNSHADPGSQLRMSLVEFSVPNDGVLSEAVFDGAKIGVATIYVRIEGASLLNKESQQLGAAPGAAHNPQLFTSSILAKIGVNRTTPGKFEVFYPPTERTASVIIPGSHLGQFTIRLTDSQGNSLSAVKGLEPFFGINGTAFFSCSLRIDTVRVSTNDGGSLTEAPSGLNARFDNIDPLVGNQGSRENVRQYLQ